ncbi:substrate-binding domain-containing protein [Sinomonas susongensis]|uniref:substrate-binding domain-containing protein n=1 Tax=Sinomonas susongensis TaxID=1324851 RepID=UPI0011089BF4|nr:substrate-binding domain-containing protein [Sinomonas susongensis]
MIRRTTLLAAAAVIALAAAGCSSSAGTTAGQDSAVSQKAETALKQVTGQVLSKGPNGETPSPASATTLTPEEIAKVKAMGATAAIVMHYGGNDWATAQIAGLKSEFEKLGIKVIATTDADFKPDKQVSDLETVMTQKPSIIVSIPTDPVATATAYRKAAQAGSKLVFMDNVPQGFVAGKDYVSDVSADNYGNGVVSAHEMAKSLGGKGKIGVIFHQADFFVTQQRYQGFKDTIAKDYPDIQIVEEKGIAGPDFAGDAQAAANAMLSKHADLAGIWAVWDVPAEGVLAAARAAGRQDLKIATEDLGKNVAIALAKNELVVGLGAQVPFDQGVTEAQIGAGSLLGKTEPAYVALSALPVDHSNVLDAWKQVYHADAPADLQSSYKK